MNALRTTLQTLLVQAHVDVGGADARQSMCPRPGGGEFERGSAAAVVAGAMSGRQRRGPSRKNSSVQLLRLMTLRFTPRNSQAQMIQALLVHRRPSSVRVAGSWMMPRLPMNMPR